MSLLSESAWPFSSLDAGRWQILSDGIDATSALGGEIWECGCHQGGTALLMRDRAHPSRIVRAFDTFSGLPNSGPFDIHPIGAMKADLKEVSHRLAPHDILVHPGVMPLSFERLEGSVISVAHIDVDQYESVKGCLEWLWPRVHSGGYLIVDDYGCAACPGAKKATDDFAAQVGVTIQRGADPQVYLIKP